MKRHFTLEFWMDDGWYVGKLKEVPSVFSQGKSVGELEENIKDAYRLMGEEDKGWDHPETQTREISIEV